jgi:para-nitrobenzyl esterase
MAEALADTVAGRLRGFRTEGVSTFLGIRYGRAPRGAEGRFRAAEAVPPWTGTTDALHYGPAAAQPEGRLRADPEASDPVRLYFPRGGQTESAASDEDCLFLNVWTPTTEPGARLPVLVWVHGGAFRAGSASATLTSGDALAATGRAVVVSVGHRLGWLGFLALSSLLGDEFRDSGSAGLTDLVLALEWVRDNIASFGGDPDNVTAFGQSGGGAKVAALLRMPRAAGLVRRCIVQSPGGTPLTAAEGARQAELFLAATGAATPRELVSLPTTRLLEAQAALPGVGPFPVADGETLLEAGDPRADALAEGVDLLVGATTHEWSLMVAGRPWYAAMDDAAVVETLSRELPDADAAALAADARERHPDEPAPLRFARIMADHTFAREATALALARCGSGSVRRYEFAYLSDADPGPLGATHCIDVPAVFGTVRWTPLLGDRPDRWQLERDVMDAWLSFAETGVPVSRDAEWPQWSPRGETVRIDAEEWTLVCDAGAATAEAPAFTRP